VSPLVRLLSIAIAALALAACRQGDASLVLTVQPCQSGEPAVVRLDVTLTLSSGQTSTQSYSAAGGGSISLPVQLTAVVPGGTASSVQHVSVMGVDASGQPVLDATADVQLAAGQETMNTVCLGLDGGVADAGSDAGPDVPGDGDASSPADADDLDGGGPVDRTRSDGPSDGPPADADGGCGDMPRTAVVVVSSTSGSDTTGNGTVATPFASITRGLREASSRCDVGTVRVFTGTYDRSIETFPLVPPASLMLLGNLNSIIDADGASTACNVTDPTSICAIHLSNPGVTVAGLQLKGGATTPANIGIMANLSGAGFALDGLNITGFQQNALTLFGSGTVSSSQLSSVLDVIHVGLGTTTLQHVSATGAGSTSEGLHVVQQGQVNSSNCTFSGSSLGVRLTGGATWTSTNDTINGNTFDGVELGNGAASDLCTASITGASIFGQGGNGIRVFGNCSLTLRGSQITGNTGIGVLVKSSTTVTFTPVVDLSATVSTDVNTLQSTSQPNAQGGVCNQLAATVVRATGDRWSNCPPVSGPCTNHVDYSGNVTVDSCQ
jgi:hypothetical protein